MVSIIKDDPKKTEINMPGNPAMIMSIAFLKTCPYKTLFSLKPFAFAVITYCFFISSKKEFFVSNVRVAKAEIVEARTGKAICQK